MKQDRNNYAVLCWRGLEGYEEIEKAARSFKYKNKNNQKEKKESTKTKDKESQKKIMAQKVQKAFRDWLDKRKKTFEKTLKESAEEEKLKSQGSKLEVKERMKKSIRGKGVRGGTQLEQLAFLFIKIMDEIASVSKKKQKKASKEEIDASASFVKDSAPA